MHVLAHAGATVRLAPSLVDARYVAWAAAALPEARPLAEDARAIGALATTHDALVTAQMVAWLFRTKERARAVGERALAELRADDVDAPEVLDAAQGEAAELVWCAALLEDEAHGRLPPIAIDDARVAAAIDAITPIAPELARCEVSVLPALRLRGRVFGPHVWVGAPCAELDVDVDHVAWQAAHEATVREVSLRSALPFDALERAALDLLAARARDAGRAAEHAAWRARFA